MNDEDAGLSDDAKEIAAKATGLRPDQIALAVRQYRKAVNELEIEDPKWQSQMFVSYRDGDGDAFFVDSEGKTGVSLMVETRKNKQYRTFYLGKKHFDTYAEARAFEMKTTTRPKPYAVPEDNSDEGTA